MCPFPVSVDKFDNDISWWDSKRPCAERHTIRSVFQKGEVLEMYALIAVRVGGYRGEIARLGNPIVRLYRPVIGFEVG